MRTDQYSEKLVESYLNKVRACRTSSDRERILSQVHDWISWLLSKGKITPSLYNEITERVEHLSKDTNGHHKPSWNRLQVGGLIALCLMIVGISFFAIRYIYTNYRNQTADRTSPSSIKNPGRTLSFKGVLTDPQGAPIDSKQDVYFKIYTSEEGENPVYTGSCTGQSGLTPEYNGVFTIVLGSSCGMRPIPESIFSPQQSLYLGVTVGSDQEIKPRYKISTSGYSMDSASLDGFSAGSTESSIPFIDENGTINLDAETSSIRASSGTFVLEGKDVRIQTEEESPGAILFQPGFGGYSAFTSGNVGIGIIPPEKRLSVAGLEPYSSIASIKNLATTEERETAVLDLGLGANSKGISPTFVNFYAESTKEQSGQRVGAIRLNNNHVVYETSGADFAEYFSVLDGFEYPPGIIVTVHPEGVRIGQPGESIVGVVTDSAGYVGNAREHHEDMTLIGLIGQINVLISDEYGPINAGDKIALGSVPGYGVVAQNQSDILGVALESSHVSDIPLSHVLCPAPYRTIASVSGKPIQCGKVKVLVRPR